MTQEVPMIIVAGMHRSGTSLLMRFLDEAGLASGRPEDRMAAAPSNQKGHWELFSVARLNDDVLAAVGSHWSAPHNDEVGPLTELANGQLGERARRLIREELAGIDVVKDPRFCLALPFWREVLDDNLVLVLPWRHPLEVAGSLNVRNGLPDRYGHWLWTEYHRQLHLHGRGLPRLVVAHRSLVSSPSEEVERLNGFLAPFLGGERPLARIDGTSVDLDAVNHRVETPMEPDDALLLKALIDDEKLSPVEGPGEDRRVAFGAVAASAIDRDLIRWRLHALRSERAKR